MIVFILFYFIYLQMMMEKTEVREGEELRVSCLARDEFHCFVFELVHITPAGCVPTSFFCC
jgi:hypothetical protein